MENFCITLFGFLLAVYMGQRIIPRILIISFRKRLFDIPDARKVHKRPVPRLGGATFFPVILFVVCLLMAFRVLTGFLPNELFEPSMAVEMLCLFAGMTLLYLIGIADDLIGVRYRKKFLYQILASSLIPIAGVYINSFYGLFGIHEVTPYIGIPLTMLLVVFITNAINLIDGIDGLASSICIVALAFYGVIYSLDLLWMYAMLAFVATGVIIPFFIYNVFGNADRGRKIFMGDTGSLTLGFLLSFLVVKYCMYDGVEPPSIIGNPLIVSFSILFVPCLDVIRVVLGRARRKAHLFQPDKTHIHHKFLAMGFTPRASLILIQTISTAFIVGTVLGSFYGVNINILFWVDVLVWTGLNIWFSKIINRRNC